MDARFYIELFGDMRVVQGEQAHTRFRTRKAAYLLAYLALNMPQAQPRERLADLFWGDKEEAAGRDGLSTALAQLRRQLEPTGVETDSLLVADKQFVRLNPAAVRTDVADFNRLLAQLRQSEDKLQKADLLHQALALYRGELLPGCYEDWAAGEQARCRSAYQESLLQLIPLWEEAGRYADALGMAQRACKADPFVEESYRAQMRLLVRLRTPTAALQLYEQMEQMFQQELGARPSAATRQMAEMIRQDPRAALLMRAEAANARSSAAPSLPEPAGVPAPPVAPISASPVPVAAPIAPPPANAVAPPLPAQLTRFFGREQEREQIVRLLQTPGTRLVSLLGPGGAGKTRLSLEVAAQAMPHFANRVWFVSLADIPDALLLAPTLSRALRLPPDTQSDPLDRVTAFLGETPCLLVLDNMEHLLRDAPDAGKNDNPALSGSVGLIQALMQRVPELVCLVTSRTALRLRGEQVFPLPPLTLPSPTDDATPETLANNPSIALYVDRARAARPDFTLTSHNAPAVIALCRRLEGMPLAIEMAAAWIKMIPPAKILERLSRQLDLLVSRHRDLPPRHQSLRATIEWSYDLLSPDLQTFFTRLGVFRGGWTLEAAEAVCGSNALYALAELQEHSLIVATTGETESKAQEEGNQEGNEEGEEAAEDAKDAGDAENAEDTEDADDAEPRYRMLEPLREYALEKLTERGEREATARRHAAWYLDLALASKAAWDGPEQNRRFGCLQNDFDNLRVALDWFAADAQSGQNGLVMAFALQRFWRCYGYLDEARRYLGQALAHPGAGEMTPERARALNGLGLVEWTRGEYAPASSLFSQALEAFRALNDRWGMAAALGNLGNIAQEMGELDRAQTMQEESLALYRALENLPGVARCLSCLANIANSRNDFAAVRAIQEEMIGIQRQLQNTDGLRNALIGLIFAACNGGDMQAARRCLREAARLTPHAHDLQDNAYLLGAAAELATQEGQMAQAARLSGAMLRLRTEHHLPLPPSNQRGVDEGIRAIRNALGAVEYEARTAEGAAYTWEQALEAAHSLAQTDAAETTT